MISGTYHVPLITRRIWKIDTISVDILFDLISNQINDIRFKWEESKEDGFRPAKRWYSLLHKEKKNGRNGDDGTNESWHSNYSTDTDTRWVCICFNWCQTIFNTHTILLTKSFSSISLIWNQIITKGRNKNKKKENKTNDDDESDNDGDDNDNDNDSDHDNNDDDDDNDYSNDNNNNHDNNDKYISNG